MCELVNVFHVMDEGRVSRKPVGSIMTDAFLNSLGVCTLNIAGYKSGMAQAMRVCRREAWNGLVTLKAYAKTA